MGIWGVVQWIATGWFVLSILAGVAWALGGRRIFRKPPAPPALKGVDDGDLIVVDLDGKRSARIAGEQ